MQGTHFDGIHDQFLQIILRLSFTKFCNIQVSQFCKRTKTAVVKLQKKHCKHSTFSGIFLLCIAPREYISKENIIIPVRA